MCVRIAPRAHISELVEYRAPAKTQAFPYNRLIFDREAQIIPTTKAQKDIGHLPHLGN